MTLAIKRSPKENSGKQGRNPRQKSDVTVFKPDRDIVASGAEELKKKLLVLVKRGVKELTIDLSGVQMMDSIGLGVVIAAHHSMSSTGGKLKVSNASEDIFQLFRTMRLDQHFEIDCA
jgi:anti-anti-sigma factor